MSYGVKNTADFPLVGRSRATTPGAAAIGKGHESLEIYACSHVGSAISLFTLLIGLKGRAGRCLAGGFAGSRNDNGSFSFLVLPMIAM